MSNNIHTPIREEPVFKYLKELMDTTYSFDSVLYKDNFKGTILRFNEDKVNIHSYHDELDFGEFSMVGEERHLIVLTDHTKFFDLDLAEIKDKRVLDIGPRFGGSSYLFLALGAKEVVAIDPSEYAIPRLEFIAHSFNLNLHSEQITFEDFECEEKFDIINCFGVFYFIKDQEKALSKMYDMLNPNGRLYIETKTDEQPGNVKPDELEKWLTNTNFKYTNINFQKRSNYIAVKEGDVIPRIINNL